VIRGSVLRFLSRYNYGILVKKPNFAKNLLIICNIRPRFASILVDGVKWHIMYLRVLPSTDF